jgi:hypothetical protein
MTMDEDVKFPEIDFDIPKRLGRCYTRRFLMVRELFLRLCEGQTLRQAIKKPLWDGAEFPSSRFFIEWMARDLNGFGEQYTRARRIGYLHMGDEIQEIADDSKNDIIVDDDGQEHFNREHVARSKLRMDARIWLMSKALPKVFGDKVQHQHKVDIPSKLEIEFKSPPPDRPRAKMIDGEFVDVTPTEEGE